VIHRNVLVAGSVLLLHLGGVWAMQVGLLQRVVEMVVPVELLGEVIMPEQSRPEPKPVHQPLPKAAAQPFAPNAVTTPPPMPLATADSSPSASAPAGVLAQNPPVPAAPVLVAAANHAEPLAPVAQHVELPSSDADYLHNPKPAYPTQSRRMREQGKVIVRVLIGVDGTAQKAEIRKSSGFERLDSAALATVQAWRYVPGRRGGVPEAMWFSVPINYVSE